MSHAHWVGGPTCDLPTKRACEDRYADWQAMQQALLAYNIALAGRTKPFRKDNGQLAQLVQFIAGEREFITNADGNPSEAPWVRRMLDAIERVKSGDLQGYNLYMPASADNQEAT